MKIIVDAMGGDNAPEEIVPPELFYRDGAIRPGFCVQKNSPFFFLL